MNTLQLSNPKEQLELEELESWDLKDFDDVMQSFELSTLENQPIWNNNFGGDADFL